MEDETLNELVREAVRQEIDKRRAAGLPVVRYDSHTGEIFHEMPDGTMMKVGDIRKKS